MRRTVSLNQKWVFAKDIHEIPSGFPDHWDAVSLPHTWNAVDGQDGGGDYFRGTCCYAKQL